MKTNRVLRCFGLAHVFDGGFAAYYQGTMLIGAFSMQRDNTLLLAQRDHFDGHGDSIADVNGGEKLQGLSQVDSSRSWERVAQYRRDQRANQEAVSDAFAKSERSAYSASRWMGL